MLLFSFATLAQTMNKSYTQRWSTVENALNKGLNATAEKEVLAILKLAAAEKNTEQQLKAMCYYRITLRDRDEDSRINDIRYFEDESAKAVFPLKPLLQSILGDLYWTYYQEHRWDIMQRTPIVRDLGERGKAELDTWTASDFYEQAQDCHLRALQDEARLKEFKVSQLNVMLDPGVHTEKLRPTLYDIICFRALEFFEHEETDLTKPAYAFEIKEDAAFAPANEFIAAKFTTRDTNSQKFRSLQLFQNLLAFHQHDADASAFIDADLLRLHYVNEFSTSTQKKQHYHDALQHIIEAHPNHPGISMAWYAIAESHIDIQNIPYRSNVQQPLNNDKSNYIEVLRICKLIQTKFPNSEGAYLAALKQQEIQHPSLNVSTEATVLPKLASLARIEFKNLQKLYCHLITLKAEDANNIYTDYTKMKSIAMSSPHLTSWTVDLPQTNDYKSHSTEIKIPELPLGNYLLVVSEHESIKENTLSAYALLGVSSLAYISRQSQNGNQIEIYTVDRETGESIPNVNIHTWTYEYDYNSRNNMKKSGQTLHSDANGLVVITKNESQQQAWYIELEKGTDHYFSKHSFYLSNYTPNEHDYNQTFFFTDRSIYRPGQTIYFKGIMMKTNSKTPNQHELMINYPTKVSLRNANGEIVKELDVSTNSFGSFAGSMQAPEGMMNGSFQLIGENGQAAIQVEEYKRPKFEVVFDTIQGSNRLNEMITVKGNARAYAGNQLDGATVKYRVFRTARFPYYWCFYRWGQPMSAEMEISNGISITKNDGSFDIQFIAIPDAQVDKNTMPIFDYRVNVDVTDVNGETRSGSTLIPVAYQALQINVTLPEQADFNDFHALEVMTTNLQGSFQESKVTLSCKKLTSPKRLYRERLWPKIDQPILSEAEFRSTFPLDAYGDENNYQNWPMEQTVWTKNITTQKSGVEYLPKMANRDGWYIIEASATDAFGETVTDKKYIRLSTYSNPIALPSDAYLLTDVQLKAEPGETIRLGLSSAYSEINLLTQVNQGALKTERKKVKGSTQFEYKVQESDRGGFSWEGIFIRDNRMYSFSRNFMVPWSNKELSITTSTFRDKMLPGSEQHWELTLRGPQKEKVSAELLATLYDASLDAYKKHSFSKLPLYSMGKRMTNFESRDCFQVGQGVLMGTSPYEAFTPYEKRYSSLLTWGLLDESYYRFGPGGGKGVMMMAEAAAPVLKSVKMKSSREDLAVADDMSNEAPMENEKQLLDSSDAPKGESPQADVKLRSNFAETAFFYPQLRTDEEGNIRFSFTAPEALTRWKLLAFGHTTSLQTGLLEAMSVTQKDLMIVPQTPRFLREGDTIVYSAKVTNLSEKEMSVSCQLQLQDAIDLTSVDNVFNNTNSSVNVMIPKGESKPITWKINVPKGFTHPVMIKTIARGNDVSDGEQNVVPVLLNSMLVTETMPLPVRSNTSKTFTMNNLLNSSSSTSLRHHGLTVEYTGNPAWYAIQSLPYLTDYPYECAEQTFNRYYANVLATHIANAYPMVKNVFTQWKEKDTAALLSNLEKNQELKNALLKETPWVMAANSEQSQKKAIANLFDMVRMSRELENTTRELAQMQTPNGGFAWFKGMPDDRFITQYIVTGIGRLLHMGIGEVTQETRLMNVFERAIPYLDQRMKEDYQSLLRHKANLKAPQISVLQIQYLYMRSYFLNHPLANDCKTAFQFYKKQAADFWLQQSKQSQAMIALVMERHQDHAKASAILQSLRENAIRNEEMGMYWKDIQQSYWWYEAPIETQSILVEAFQEIGGNATEVDELKIWLLKNKQTQQWATTKATADACYALMLQGTEWLQQEPTVRIQLGDEKINSANEKKEAGTGYFKHHFEDHEVKASMGNISVSVDGKGVGTSWGAVYWQYFEELDKIKFAATPLSLHKEIYVERNSDKGPVLTKITAQMPLQVGDKLKVRIELRVDRDMEYVHLKDMRASCLEPTNVISQYKYQYGLGYYESTKDASTSFFFHWLPKGSYIFEYPMMVTNRGDFSNGIATIQCMYAPEFSSHSNGIRLQVK